MAVDDATIQAWLQQNAGASDADIRSAMDQYGVDTSQMARATGMDYETMQSRYDAAGPAPAPAPVPAPAPAPNGLLAQPQQYTDDQVRSWISQYYDPAKGDWSTQGNARERLASDMQKFGVGFDQMGRVLGMDAYGGIGTRSVENLYAAGFNGGYNRSTGSGLDQGAAARDAQLTAGFNEVKGDPSKTRKWMTDNNVSLDDVKRISGTGMSVSQLANWTEGTVGGMGNAHLTPEAIAQYKANGYSDEAIRQKGYWVGGFDDYDSKITKLRNGVPDPNSKFATGGSAPRGTVPGTGGVTPLPGGPGVTSPGGQSTGKQPVSDDSIRQWLSNNPNASDRQIRAAMDQTGVTPSQLARATGMSEAEISRRYFSAGSNIPTSGPGDTSPGGPTLPGTSGGDPVSNPAGPNWRVDDPQTVEGRLNNLLKTDDGGTYTNPVIRQAVDRALQAFNGRGLLNSSMAQQAAQEAAISKATEIAKSDAATYAEAAKTNNQNAWQSGENNANRNLDWQKAWLSAETSLKQSNISQSTQVEIAEMNRKYAQQANNSQAVSGLLSQYNSSVTRITESDLTVEAKEAALAKYKQVFMSGVKLIGSINGDTSFEELLNSLFPNG